MPLHPDLAALAEAMRRLAAHLAAHDEPHWADAVGRSADWVADSDRAGLDRFLALFGGMGSLDDLVLHRDGRPLTGENGELERLRGEAWELADRLRYEDRCAV